MGEASARRICEGWSSLLKCSPNAEIVAALLRQLGWSHFNAAHPIKGFRTTARRHHTKRPSLRPLHKTRNDTARSSCGNAVIFGHTIATARLHEVPLPSGNTKVWLCYIRAMLLDALRVKREAILALGNQYGARHIRVFGSVARGEERPDSDVDFLVDFPRGYDMFGQRLALAERLAGLVGRRVEVVPEHELNRHIRSVVLKEAVDL